MSEVTLLGAEMLTWSDASGRRGEFRGPLAPYLIGGTGRVLVAGPTSAAVVADLVATHAGADVLVRSLTDARSLRAALPASVGVFCGPLDRFVTGRTPYDVVVAVAGLDRLHSAEDAAPRPEDVLRDLAGLVVDGGRLVIGVDNEAGADRLVGTAGPSRYADADWPEGEVLPPQPDLAAALALLAGHGLTPDRTWHCHGDRSVPSAAATPRLLTEHAGSDLVQRAVAEAYVPPAGSGGAVTDPVAPVRALVRAGLGAATAPLTIVSLSSGTGPSSDEAVLLVGEGASAPAPAVVRRLEHDGAGWRRTVLTPAYRGQVAPGAVRDTTLLEGPVPDGPTLASVLEDCIAAHDLSAASRWVRRFRAYLGEDRVEPGLVPSVPRSVVVVDDGLAALDPGLTATSAAEADVVLVRGLLDLGAGLLARGTRHPWSPAASARDVARALAPAAGIEDLDSVVDAAVALDRTLRAPGTAPDLDAPGNLGRLPYAELSELAERLGVRAAQADEHVIWLLKRMQARQRMLRDARREIDDLQSSRELWIGRKVMVLNSVRRRWRRRRDRRRAEQVGQWTGGPNPDLAETRIEAELAPPGYEPPPGTIEIVPTQDPPMDGPGKS